MGNIQVLSQHVADLIAAGEVVERPASVAKELIENAIDAGATFITVEIRNGGISYLRVTDDGKGMTREDAKNSLLRHSTSKIHGESDLEHIATLGFRGEALAAIVAVSKLDMLTKPHGDNYGTALHQEGGKIISVDEAGGADGTTMVVRELFYNTPARMKFLKKDSAEGAAVEAVVVAAALSHPGISFKFLREGSVSLHTPGDSKRDSCIYSVLGRDIANGMVSINNIQNGVAVSGYASKPITARGNRAMQYFFVNGRAVKSKMLTAALEGAYANLIMRGRFPTCVIEISLPVELTDVNVHPTKTEIKFAREKEVFSALHYAVKSVIAAGNEIVTAKEETRQTVAAPIIESPIIESPIIESPIIESPKVQKRSVTAYSEEWESVLTLASPDARAPATIEISEAPFRYIGEVLNTYIIVEDSEGIVLIDKHAAHERIVFEELKRQKIEPQRQRLLSPVIVKMTQNEIVAIESEREKLAKLGFEVDTIGMGCVAVRETPDGIAEGDISAAIGEVAAIMATSKPATSDERMDEILHSIACKAAIKAGQKNGREELMKIAKTVMDNDSIRYCPHGRPVAVRMTTRELSKLFKRT